MGIVPITLFHVSQHSGITHGFSLFAQLFPAPLRALGAGGREEYLHLRAGQDSRAHIAPVHHHVVCLCHAALQPKQVVAHGQKGRHAGGCHAHRLCAHGCGDILSVQIDMLCAVLIREADVYLVQQGLHGSTVPWGHTLPQRIQPYGAEHGARVYIHIAQLFGKAARQGGFSCPGGAVDGNGDHVFSSFLFAVLRAAHAGPPHASAPTGICRAAALAVAKARPRL